MEKVEQVKNFILNDKVQNVLSQINDNLMDFNILEITGMGTQEIKHSNILGWLFDDSEHNLEYQILDNFLKQVIKENEKNNLQSYTYLSNKTRDITIYREKDNIDLLIIDESNKIVITIENKIYARERTDGEDGGQLQKYEDLINKKYNNSYEKYFIFLTTDLKELSKKNWLRANHQMVTDVIEDILKTKEITTKTKIVLESYVDLLKRNHIVEDKYLEELCEKIWANGDYANALDVLLEYRLTPMQIIYNKILKKTKGLISNNDYFLQLNSIEKLYQQFNMSWEESESIFEVNLYYDRKSDSVHLQYFYGELKNQNGKLKEICKKITSTIQKNSVSTKIMEKNRANIVDNNIDFIVEEFIVKIKEIDEKIMEIIDKNQS